MSTIPKHHSNASLGGGFKHFLFSSLPEEMIHFDYFFSDGLVQPPTRISLPTPGIWVAISQPTLETLKLPPRRCEDGSILEVEKMDLPRNFELTKSIFVGSMF